MLGTGLVERHSLKMNSVIGRAQRRHMIDTDPLKQFIISRFNLAVITNNIEKVKRLLESGTSPNICDEHGRTPLHLASCRFVQLF